MTPALDKAEHRVWLHRSRTPTELILLAKSSKQRTDAAEGRDGGRISRRFRLVSDFASSNVNAQEPPYMDITME